jgi:chemotaxis protein MotA
MPLTYVIGLVLCLVAIVGSTIMDGNSFGPLLGPSSFVLVFFCAVGTAMMSNEMADMKAIPKAMIRSLKSVEVDFNQRISYYLQMADLVRRDGLLALESRIKEIDDRFVQYGLQMLTDGTDEATLRTELDTWVDSMVERHSVAPAFLRKLAVYSPAFGMVGTVIGLVNMLGNLSSPEQLGGGMALALLTTLYGSLFANLFFQPLAERLDRLHEIEMAQLAFDTDAIIALQAGSPPRAIVDHLESLLPPSERIGFDERKKAA